MNILTTILVCSLFIVAISLGFRYRRLFLIDLTPAAIRQARPALLSILLLPLAGLALCLELLRSPYWGHSTLFDLSPVLINAGYIFQLFLFRHLAPRWKRSTLFKLAILSPVVGCLLMTLIWWHERDPHHSGNSDPA
jgi:hypothetical protein